jgi:hypothetical protein
MKPPSYVILVALLLAALLLLWPRTTDRSTAVKQEGNLPAPAVTGNQPTATTRELPRLDVPNRSAVRAPEVADMVVNPESPPEQTVEWQIARQQAMLKALQRHLATTESKWRNTTEPAERQTLEEQIQILRTELTNQQAVLRGLQE